MSTIEGLPARLVEGLQSLQAYPNETGGVSEVAPIQTHISWLFFSATRVYKIRKAVNFGFAVSYTHLRAHETEADLV
mgnify:CR=1 FL=1